MKFLLTIFATLLLSPAFSQTDTAGLSIDSTSTDTIPGYKKLGYLPTFSIQLPDSSWFSKSQLPESKPILILYFSPDCEHCMLETEDIISKMKSLQNLQIVMITSRPFDEMKNFADHYKLHRFKNVIIGRDAQRRITRFYDVKFTPFSALYNKNGQFIASYEKGLDWNELIALIR